MGSGITYNGRVSYVIFLLFNKKLRGLERAKTLAPHCHVHFLLSDQSIFIALGRGRLFIFFWGGGRGGVAWFLEGMGWIWVVVNRV